MRFERQGMRRECEAHATRRRGQGQRMALRPEACDTDTKCKPPEREGEAANGNAPER